MSLTALLIVAATIATGLLSWAAVETALTMRLWRTTTAELAAKVHPLLDKADVTIDAANVELLRIDGAITVFEEASVRVSAASGTLSEIVQAPAEIVNGVAERVRRKWKERKRADDAPHTNLTTEDGQPDEDVGARSESMPMSHESMED